MPKVRAKKSKKRSFHGNRFSAAKPSDDTISTASSSKLKFPSEERKESLEDDVNKHGNRIFDINTLISVFAMLCCPECFETGLELEEDSKFGLCSNFCLLCKCGFKLGFSSTPKKDNKNIINSFLVLGLRLIGKGYTSGKKLLFTLNLPFISKTAFRRHECQLLEAVQCVSENNMKEAAKEVKDLKSNVACGVSVDGTWQRRGHTSLNGCVSVISIDTGKILDLEVMSQYCHICSKNYNTGKEHTCSNHSGSSASMEVVGVYRMFERSIRTRELQYTEYYGDGDSKGFMEVKNIYGKNSVSKLECIGHVQKRVGSRLRKLKKTQKGLGGKGKVTDKFIDKLQNYYGIAIRSNVGNLKEMQSAVIAAFFHCCSGGKKNMHGQCPVGPNSWCKFQRALYDGHQICDKSPGLPDSVVNIIKPTYMSLCDQTLLEKCLHGMTQNRNESLNNVIWTILPKETFVGLQTLLLGAHIAVLLFNSGYLGILPIFSALGIPYEEKIVLNYLGMDKMRVMNSKRHSLPSSKMARKKRRAVKKSKSSHYENKEGCTYKSGAF